MVEQVRKNSQPSKHEKTKGQETPAKGIEVVKTVVENSAQKMTASKRPSLAQLHYITGVKDSTA